MEFCRDDKDQSGTTQDRPAVQHDKAADGNRVRPVCISSLERSRWHVIHTVAPPNAVNGSEHSAVNASEQSSSAAEETNALATHFRQDAGGEPALRLNARLNAASDS